VLAGFLSAFDDSVLVAAAGFESELVAPEPPEAPEESEDPEDAVSFLAPERESVR